MPAPPTTRSRSNRPAIRLPASAGAMREEINEIARQRIDRRPIDDRRLFALAIEPAGVEHDQNRDAGHRQQQAAEQHRPSAPPFRRNPPDQAKAATPPCRRGSARPDRAAPAPLSPAAQTADRMISACAGRAPSPARIPRPGSASRSRSRWSAAAALPRSTRRTRRCDGPARSTARNAAATAPITAAPAPADRTRPRAN